MDVARTGGFERGSSGPLDWWELFGMLAATYGWTHRDILNLTVQQFMRYIGEVPKIEARNQIRRIESSSYPNMDKNARKKIDRYYSQILRPLTQNDINSTWDMLKVKKGGYRGRTGKRKASSRSK